MSNDDDASEVYQGNIWPMVDMFIAWMSTFENQPHFHSVQQAYKNWLWDEGFGLVEGNYSDAVAVMLLFLSRCIANPYDRRYLSSPPGDPDEFTLLQVLVPEAEDDRTFWGFLTEVNFRQAYEEWRESRR